MRKLTKKEEEIIIKNINEDIKTIENNDCSGVYRGSLKLTKHLYVDIFVKEELENNIRPNTGEYYEIIDVLE